MQVPNEKSLHQVGLIIGRGGDVIKALQAKSGARIQLIPQHLPEGDGSKERTVRVTGDRKQIEMAREMIKDVMNQHLVIHGFTLISGISLNILLLKRWIWHKSDQLSGACLTMMLDCEVITLLWQFRPTAFLSTPWTTGPSNWGPRGPHSSQPNPYDYHLRGPYPSQSSQYPPPSYGAYPPNKWAQEGGHVSDHPESGPISTPVSGHAPSPSPTPAMSQSPSQANYNYGQPHGPDYGHQAPYSQAVPSQQGYGHGYDEPKPSQPGDMPYQGPIQSSQSCCPNVPPQQQYPYASSGQSYPSNGSASGAEGNNQAMPTSSPGYPQQGSQPVPCYRQPNGQQSTGYVQGPTGGYGLYPSSQQCYREQPASNNAGYGYQGSQDPAYGSGPGATYSAPPSGQQAYAQSTTTQPSYDQSVPQSGAYGAAPGSAPVGYGKNLISLAHLPSI
ncbi:hypothetical protein GH714_012889 [Hevea brasiliensis]|uniref:K Homology domain-containing protein n=1 Tax=Hevea brasiliensis TaxID=3981 RepID=A0A6A6KQD0_HEVBR|nr:hypothetical protein GH714_012889 [Hevea brasiliensis]